VQQGSSDDTEVCSDQSAKQSKHELATSKGCIDAEIEVGALAILIAGPKSEPPSHSATERATEVSNVGATNSFRPLCASIFD
jgi:hypothetical protein